MAGIQIAEVQNVPAGTPISKVFDDGIATAIKRWHWQIEPEYGAENLEDLLAVPVGKISHLLSRVPTVAEVAAWAEETGKDDPNALVADLQAKIDARKSAIRERTEWAAKVAGGAVTESDASERLRELLTKHSDLFDSSAELRHLRDFAHARRVGTWAALGIALMRTTLAVDPRVVLPPTIGGEVSLNLLLALCGVSSGGKGSAEKAAAAAFRMRSGGRERKWDANPIGTGEGINRTFGKSQPDPVTKEVTTVIHTRSAMFTCRDITTLDALKSRSGSTLTGELLKSYMGEELGFSNAGADTRVVLPMHSYRLGLSAGVQPENGGTLVNVQAQRDGMTQRILWLPTKDGMIPPRLDTPDPMVLDVPDFGLADPTNSFDEDSPLVVLDIPSSIADEIIAADDAKSLDVFGRSGDAMAGHRLLTQLKVAAAFSLLHGHTEVRHEDWERAAVFIAVSTATGDLVAAESANAAVTTAQEQGRIDAHRRNASTDTAEAQNLLDARNKVLELLRASGDWTNKGALNPRLTARLRSSFGAAVLGLVAEGRIEQRMHEYQKNSVTEQYRISV